MKRLLTAPLVARTLAFTLLFLGSFSLAARAGIDSYEIYLNNRLLVRQSLLDPLKLSDLALTAANADDHLIIRYSQCNAPGRIGRNRSITLKDASGHIVKTWKFKDGGGSPAEMRIPVREILAAKKSSPGALTFYYMADGQPKEQELAMVGGRGKRNG